MTIEEYKVHVDLSIVRALRHDSAIDESVLALTGFSTGVMRRLVSNLAHLPKPNPVYLEIGLFAGASICAAMSNNPTLTAIGIDNFSQDFGRPEVRAELHTNFDRYSQGALAASLRDADCFTVDPATLPKADIYFFDGEHSQDSQMRALPHFLPALNSPFIFIVDDSNWIPVSEGTRLGFQNLRKQVRIEHHRHLTGARPNDDPIWHNGVDIYVCSKL